MRPPRVGELARCTCRDSCQVIGEVVEISVNDHQILYNIKWYLPEAPDLHTYDSVANAEWIGVKWSVWQDICEIPL